VNAEELDLARRVARWAVVAGAASVALIWASDFGDPAWRCEADPVIVAEGDTLDSIVRGRCSGDANGALDAAYDSYGAVVYPGQVVWLPAREGCAVRIVAGDAYEDC